MASVCRMNRCSTTWFDTCGEAHIVCVCRACERSLTCCVEAFASEEH